MFLCGAYRFSGDIGTGLLEALPRVLTLQAAVGDPLRDVIALLSHELANPEPGQPTVLDRLLDVLLVLAIRSDFRRSPNAPRWYRACADPRLSAALQAMHEDAGATGTDRGTGEPAPRPAVHDRTEWNGAGGPTGTPGARAGAATATALPRRSPRAGGTSRGAGGGIRRRPAVASVASRGARSGAAGGTAAPGDHQQGAAGADAGGPAPTRTFETKATGRETPPWGAAVEPAGTRRPGAVAAFATGAADVDGEGRRCGGLRQGGHHPRPRPTGPSDGTGGAGVVGAAGAVRGDRHHRRRRNRQGLRSAGEGEGLRRISPLRPHRHGPTGAAVAGGAVAASSAIPDSSALPTDTTPAPRSPRRPPEPTGSDATTAPTGVVPPTRALLNTATGH
ncbi:cupin domain-containing protein [Kitasatospora sp. NPDC087314]|uniref:cupin domain-containing protein n=1 Tax=Kitasatospora sp. NPDC087314 TaxID=3364068 RepID=UPI00382B9974